MTSSFSELVNYFERIARNIRAIRHSDSEKHFFRMEVEEVLAGINRTDVCYPFFILEGYSFSYLDHNSDNLIKNRRGAFMLIDRVSDPTDIDAIHRVWDHMEEIGDEIILKIKSDKRNPLENAIRDFDFSSVEAVLIANELEGNYGIRFSYIISSLQNMSPDFTKWIPQT